jgi:hypothetical protein
LIHWGFSDFASTNHYLARLNYRVVANFEDLLRTAPIGVLGNVTQLRAILLWPKYFFFDHYLSLWGDLLAALKFELWLCLIEGGVATDTVICNRRVVV